MTRREGRGRYSPWCREQKSGGGGEIDEWIRPSCRDGGMQETSNKEGECREKSEKSRVEMR